VSRCFVINYINPLIKFRLPSLDYSWSKLILFRIKDYFVPYSRGKGHLFTREHLGYVLIVIMYSGFRFPLAFLGAVVAMSMLLYQVLC